MRTLVLEKYINHSTNVIRAAQQHLYQANYETATGEGLDDIARAIGLKEIGTLETDSELRDRIRDFIFGNESL